jgi:hypothetical protein
MNNIRVDIRLRPIRFGFLVRPDDAESMLEIFRINTCLWGGKFNPIIPIFESVPSWLEDEGFHFENSKQMINDYLDFFEPDFLIEAEEGLAEGFGFDPERVRKLADMIEEPGGSYIHRYGLSVNGLYTDLYTKEHQFEQRHRIPFVHVQPADTTFTNFVAGQFGSFPTQERLRYFERNHKVIFNPKPIALDAAALAKLYQSGYSSALEIGCAKLQVGYNAPLLSTLFILDARESKDIVDFWNLRAIHQHVRAVPIQWIEELSPFCKEFIRDNYRRQPNDSSPNMVGPVLMFSRSLSEGNVEEMVENFSFVEEGDVYTIQRWAPTIWYKLSEQVASPTRPTLAADRKIMNVQIDGDNPEIRFDPLFPEFMSEYNLYRVANVVKLQDWSDAEYVVRVRDRSDNDQIATVFPCNYKNPSVPKFQPEFLQEQQYILPTTEGLVIFPYRENFSELWNLVDGTTAFNQWFNDKQVLATRSDAGRATEQIIQILGDLKWGVLCLAYKGVIDLLNEMSNSSTKSFHYQKFQSKIRDAVNSKRLKNKTFETLIERKVVELGLELKCSKCSKWSWYPVNQLDYSLICNFCFKQLDFPIIDPTDKKHSKWAYRVVGPFALPKYADGGYAAALAIRFFADVIGGFDQAGVTWSSAQELKLSTDKKVEADFMLWYRRKEIFGTERGFFGRGLPIFGLDRPTETVFGEAKSFGKDAFKQCDVNKMKLLAEKFPGSILVFATMKDELSPEEIDRIKELAEWGREYDKERRQTRAPVIVLTGTELFTTDYLSTSWEEKGGKHKDLAEDTSIGTLNLRILANFTQHLYLDLDMLPYGPTMAQRRKTMTLRRESIGRN